MRKVSELTTIAAFLLLASLFVQAEKREPVPAMTEILDSVLEHERYPGVSLAVFYKGEFYAAQQAGFANIDSAKAPDQDTVFRMYSLTKGVTQILAAVLVDEGLLDLDMAVSNYVADLPEEIRPITVRQLLDHRGGIRHYKSNQEWMQLSQQHCESPEDAYQQFLYDPLIDEPGTKTAYSSFGYVLLSQVLVSAAEKPFQQLVEDHVWRPGKVDRIELDDPAEGHFENVSTFYEPLGDGYIEAPAVDNSCKFGGGAINATPVAMARIFSEFYQANLTSKETLEQFVPAVLEERKEISIGGEGLGGRSALVAYPADGLVVVMVANARGGDLKGYAEKVATAVYAINESK